MAPRFHALKVADLRRETDDAVSVAFAVPEELRETFAFAQGQFVTLRTELDGAEVRRSYSICSGLDDGELRVAIKHVEGGAFSTFANENLVPGAELEVLPPDGRFGTPLDPEAARHYVGFVAGSGITPVLSIIRTVLAREPKSRFTLVYGNRTVGSILFREALEDLKDRYPARLQILHVLSRERQEIELFNGRLDAAKVGRLLETLLPVGDIDEAFICGPLPMIEAVRDTLAGAGMPEKNIHFELFTDGRGNPLGVEAMQHAQEPAPPSGAMHRVTLVLDGIRSEFEAPEEGPSLLDAALATRPELPFACKGGMCCTCRARLVSGEVRQDKTYGLEPEEIAQGFILTCQSHPVSGEIEIDYDRR